MDKNTIIVYSLYLVPVILIYLISSIAYSFFGTLGIALFAAILYGSLFTFTAIRKKTKKKANPVDTKKKEEAILLIKEFLENGKKSTDQS